MIVVRIRLTGGAQDHAASVSIDLMKAKPREYRRALADGVYRALVEAVGAPENA
jgi:phenylpyruvate tautomerase PptA (4-oxalocrotonate tautomerase family)